jgi:hypothetical protein
MEHFSYFNKGQTLVLSPLVLLSPSTWPGFSTWINFMKLKNSTKSKVKKLREVGANT